MSKREPIIMKRFVDRKKELQALRAEYEREEASFVVIYGRRRIGKTELISEFCRNRNVISFLATEENEEQNRAEFQRVVAEYTGNALLKEGTYGRWEPIFSVIAEEAKKDERLILVIDEFQYLGKANKAFPSVFMKIWDTYLKDTNIMLILCGSLIRMMTDQVLRYDSPLYGRRTAQLRMVQIPFSYYCDFTPTLSEKNRIEHYAVTGGVPKYIEIFGENKDIYNAIQTHILNSNAFLYAEPDFLLAKEVSEVGSYFSLMRVIAAGAHRLSEIASRLEVKQSNLTTYLNTLMELDLIERCVPVTEASPEKSKMGQYRIKDNFIRFWFRFIYPYRGELERQEAGRVMERIREQFIENHVSFVYEEICRYKVIEGIEGLPGVSKSGSWWDNKHAEIDVVAFDDGRKNMIFGECKYSGQPKGTDVYYSLKEKRGYVKTDERTKQEYYVIFSVGGFTEDLKRIAAAERNLVLVERLGDGWKRSNN